MDTSAKDCLVLFDTSVEGKLACGWESGVLHQRTRTVKAGPMVYVDCYPVWDTAHARAANTEAKKEAHAKAQKRLDAKRRELKVEQLTNANFGAQDLILTMEYPLNRQPESGEKAKADIVNYLRRVNYARTKRGLLPLRYIYVTEWTQSEKYGLRWHHHVIMSGDGMTREEVEEKWTSRHKGFCNTRRAQPNERVCQISGTEQAGTRGKKPTGQGQRADMGTQPGLEAPHRERGRQEDQPPQGGARGRDGGGVQPREGNL